MVQGKPKDEREEQAQRAERERREKLKIDDEWASGANTGMSRSSMRGLFCCCNSVLQQELQGHHVQIVLSG